MLYYKATAGWWGWVFVGVSDSRCASAPPPLLSSVLPLPLAAILSPAPPVAHSLVPFVFLAPSSRPPAHPPPRIVSALPSLTLRGPLLLGVSSYPPAFFTPLLALPSYPSFTLSVFPEEQLLPSRPSGLLLLWRRGSAGCRRCRRLLPRCGVARHPLLPPRMSPCHIAFPYPCLTHCLCVHLQVLICRQNWWRDLRLHLILEAL